MIHAVGLAPALDVVYTVPAIEPGGLHRPTEVVRSGGGKTLTAARALALVGVPVRAIVPLGGPIGELVAELLAGSGVELRVLRTATPTRMCVSVADLAAGSLTEFYERPEPIADGDEVLAQLAGALDAVAAGDEVAVSGSFPAGIDVGAVAGLLSGARERGARLAIDLHGAELAALLPHADLVKVNRAEAAELAGAGSAEELLVRLGERTGAAVVITDGARGSVGRDPRDGVVIREPGPRHPGGFPVGSGDCYLAGVLEARAAGGSLAAAMRRGALLAELNARTPGGGRFDPPR